MRRDRSDDLPAGGDYRCDPCGKTSYPSRKRAEFVAGRQKLRLYKCPHENGFHLGHKPLKVAYDIESSHRPVPTIAELEAWALAERGLS